jgi:hypothetical protein
MTAWRSILVGLLLSGCTLVTPGAGSVDPSGAALPTGSRLSSAGYLTVLQAPPSPFPDAPPPEPKVVDDFARRTSSPDPLVRARAWEEANGSPEFQRELQRLREVLAREEADFVDVRLVRDPSVAAEIWFKRDAARKLARHTSNPLFRPREGGLDADEQERLRSLWAGRAGGGDLINLFGVDPFTGVVELGIAVEEAEFRRAAASRGWELGPQVKLSFPPPVPPAFAAEGLERRVRTFARESRAKGVQLTAGSVGRIVLEDGCFRLAGSRGEPGPLVLFGRETQLSLDRQGYVVVLGEGGRTRYRVGEVGSWPGPNTVDENDPNVRELRRRCGGGPISNVAEPESRRLFSAPYAEWVADYARARSLSYQQAWREVIACMEREERRGRSSPQARDRCIRQFN